MTARRLLDPAGRLLNHVELVYRPGARQRVAALFETLGCQVIETGGAYLVIQVDPTGRSWLHNVLYASEVTPTQWRFESALEAAGAAQPELAAARDAWLEARRVEPQRTTHFGLRLRSEAELDAILSRVTRATEIATAPAPPAEGPPARGEAPPLELAGVLRPGDPGALSDRLIQAFVHTRLCAAGLVTLGQHIELQVDLSATPGAAPRRG